MPDAVELADLTPGARAVLGPYPSFFTAKACASVPITLSNTQTVDGTALVAGDYCLAIAQGSFTAMGLWVVQSGASWTRPPNAPSGATLPVGYMVAVGLGSNIGLWQSINGTPIIVDTTNQFFGRPSIGLTNYARRIAAFQNFR